MSFEIKVGDDSTVELHERDDGTIHLFVAFSSHEGTSVDLTKEQARQIGEELLRWANS